MSMIADVEDGICHGKVLDSARFIHFRKVWHRRPQRRR
jgi:hypothetical protein